MVKNIRIRQICTRALSCEPLLERMPNGELLCLCQCGGTTEPAPENRVYAFHSRDNGETWQGGESVYPEDGRAVYCTELSVSGNEITAWLTLHVGRFLEWRCTRMVSRDNGYTWTDEGPNPLFPEYTFMRQRLETSDGRVLHAYQNYPVTREMEERTIREFSDQAFVDKTGAEWCESGVMESRDGGKTWMKCPACRMAMNENWIWSEPTIAELSDGRLTMLMRKCRSGRLWQCDSPDGGRTWGNFRKTDIPNPSNKPRLYSLGEGRIGLVHTPNGTHGMEHRSPLCLWISEDDMKSWSQKIVLTDFPGSWCYNDGFYENEHLRLTIEYNRHTALYFDIDLSRAQNGKSLRRKARQL